MGPDVRPSLSAKPLTPGRSTRGSLVRRRGVRPYPGTEPLSLAGHTGQDVTLVDTLLQRRPNPKAAKRFFRRVLKGRGEAPRRPFSDKLGSYRVAARTLLPGTPQDTRRYANNRVERSLQPTRQQERQMRRFKSRHQAQRFLSPHARVNNLFRYGRHLRGAANHLFFRASAFPAWRQSTCA